MNICVFDTETTALEKPFCYNIGYAIIDTETATILTAKDRVAEQVWHNPMLFTTAYYADKREIYVERMRARQTKMDKFGFICQEMIRDFEAYGVSMAFAFNSDFDERVFKYNCEWFKCNNPFDNIEIKDIRGFAHEFIVDKEYKAFCDEFGYYTESGNYSTTAEIMYRYIVDNEFVEEHTALADSLAEWAILKECVERGAELTDNYKARQSIAKTEPKEFTVKKNGEVIFKTEFTGGARYYKNSNAIYLRD